jgi:chromosomal replication initiator protein
MNTECLVMTDLEVFWADASEKLKQQLSSQQFNTWIKPLHARIEDDRVILYAPNRFMMQFIKDRFLARIELLAQHWPSQPSIELRVGILESIVKEAVDHDETSLNKSPNEVQLLPDSTEESRSNTQRASEKYHPENTNMSILSQTVTHDTSKVKRSPAVKVIGGAHENTRLNANFSFESLVKGKANQLAYAAAQQVAESPGDAGYNPLFVYGGVGLGKTHLIQAIGNYIYQKNPQARIRYIHAERYVADIMRAYQHKAFDEFKRYYHSLDLLLIDDIQFFAGKNRTQEEFFYAFNALIEGGKQVIMTCDTYPKHIEGMEERLTSRFAWGLTVEIEPPELEMRVAILKQKAETDHFKLDNQVALLIAQNIRSNVRELEGALKRVVAYSRFVNEPISIELAREALRDVLAAGNRQVSVETIQKAVAEYYKIRLSDMHSKKRSRDVARPRQVAMSLVKELLPNISTTSIGGAFGNRDHTTVLHAHKTIDELRNTDPDLARDYQNLVHMLKV